jgi:AbrB family looped-hinge helix DNA binding protein
MEISATVTSKGQVTIPKEVRDALGVQTGDRVTFQVQEGGAVLRKVPSFLHLAGSVPVPAELSGKTWTQIREETWRRVAQDAVLRSKRS